MGRHTDALTKPATLSELAQCLQELRRRSGLSYRQMERNSIFRVKRNTHFLKFYRASCGHRLPDWQVVHDYVRICGGDRADIQQAKWLWKRAEAAVAPAGDRPRRCSAPLPQFVGEPFELLDAMRVLRIENGSKSLRELERAATVEGVSHLPHSTLAVVLKGQRMPSRHLLLTFVRFCGGVEPGTRAAEMWGRAWDRADAYRRGQPVPAAEQLDAVAHESTQADAKPDPAAFRSAAASRRRRAAQRSAWRRLAGRLSSTIPPTLPAGGAQGP